MASTTGRRPPAAAAVAVGLVVAVLAAFSVWTVHTGGSAVRPIDRYNAMVDGFAHGQLNLLQKPSPGLLALADPLDPTQNEPFRGPGGLGDLSLYHGKLFAYWGPAPALTFFWPARWIGLHPSESDAVLAFGLLALLAGALLVHLMLARWAPRTPLWLELMAVAVLSIGDVVPFNLRNPGVYQVAQVGAQAFLLASLAALVAALGRTRSRAFLWLLGLSSLLLGLAVGTRAPFVLAIVFPLAALATWWRGGARLRRRRLRRDAALALLAPVGLCVLAVALYNHARFGSFTQIGTSFQLTSPDVPRGATQRLANVVPGLFFYLLAPLQLHPDFPFAHQDFILSARHHVGLPSLYTFNERTIGLLTGQPFVALAGLLLALRRRGGVAREGALAGGLVLSLAVVLLLFDAWAANGTTTRYEGDFLPLALLAAVLGWAGAATQLRSAAARAAAKATGAVLAAFGLLVGLALSLNGADNQLVTVHPDTAMSLARRLTWFIPLTVSAGFDDAGGQWARMGPALIVLAVAACLAWVLGGRVVPPRAARIGAGIVAAGLLLLFVGFATGRHATVPVGTGRALALGAGALALSGGLALRARSRAPVEAGS